MNYAPRWPWLFLISANRHDLREGASWNSEFYRWRCGITEDLAAGLSNRRNVLVEIVHLDCEVVNAWPATSSQSHVGLDIVVFEKGEINFAIAQTIPAQIL